MNPIYVKFYLVQSRAKQGTYPIYCRITCNRKKAEFFTGYYADYKKWDEGKERIKGSPELNAILSNIETRANQYYLEKTVKGNTPTAKELKAVLQGKSRSTNTVLGYFETFIDEISKLPDQYTLATVKKYKTIKRHLSEFLDGKKISEIPLSDFNLALVNEFDFYLRSKVKLNQNTTAKYLKQFKAVFNRAIQFGFINDNPFRGYKFSFQKTNRTFLTPEEIKILEELEIPNESLDKVRDCFIFAIYTGLRYSDVCNLTKKHLQTDAKGKHWIEFQIQKTKENTRVPLLDKAFRIVAKYQNEKFPFDKLLPAISHQKVNTFLKILGNMAGLNKILTFHVARHTFATTVTLSNNVPIEVVQKLLGHANLSSTQIYAKITQSYLDSISTNLNNVLANGK
jgi:integrase